MKFFRILFSIVLIAIAFASIVPHLVPDHWLTDIFSHFKPQYIILLLIALLAASLFTVKNSKISAVIIFLLLVWNSWFVVPLYLQQPQVGETSGESLSILCMNLLASNTDYSAAVELVREKDPDVVVLLELSPQWEKEMQVLKPEFPFQKVYPQTDNFGIGILSKMPMVATVTDFDKGYPPSIFSEMKIGGSSLSILATHPVPPVGQDKFKFRNDQLRDIAKLSSEQTGNFILVGDLNTSSYSRHFVEMQENGNLKDSRRGFQIATTWPTDYLFLRTTLDHFLLKGNVEVISRTTERSIGSDHLPIFIRVKI